MKKAWRSLAKLGIAVGLLVSLANPAVAGGVYLSGWIYCASSCCCSDNLNSGCRCQGCVPDAWQYGSMFCIDNMT